MITDKQIRPRISKENVKELKQIAIDEDLTGIDQSISFLLKKYKALV